MENGNFDVNDNYNKKLKPIATDEESKIHPSSIYGTIKQCQEQLIMTVCTTSDSMHISSLSKCLWAGTIIKKSLYGYPINIFNPNKK